MRHFLPDLKILAYYNDGALLAARNTPAYILDARDSGLMPQNDRVWEWVDWAHIVNHEQDAREGYY